MQIKIRVVRGSTVDHEIVAKTPAVVGRSRTADLKLSHSLVSRQHCILFEQNEAIYVRDLDSLNGTFVGKKKIAKPTLLSPGATFTVGPVTMRVDYDSQVATPNDSVDEPTSDELATTGLVAATGVMTTAIPPVEEPPADSPDAALERIEASEEPPLELDFSEGVVTAPTIETPASDGHDAAAVQATTLTPRPSSDSEFEFELLPFPDELVSTPAAPAVASETRDALQEQPAEIGAVETKSPVGDVADLNSSADLNSPASTNPSAGASLATSPSHVANNETVFDDDDPSLASDDGGLSGFLKGLE